MKTTPVKSKKRRALSSPGQSTSDSSIEVADTPEKSKYKLPLEIREFDKIDIEVKSHLYNVKMSIPSKEPKNRTQAVDDAVNYLYCIYERVTRAYVEIATKWNEFENLKEQYFNQTQTETQTTIPVIFEKEINTKFEKLKESIISDVKEVVQNQIRDTMKQQIEKINKNNNLIHENFQCNIKNTVSDEVKHAVNKVQEVVQASMQHPKLSYSAVAKSGISNRVIESINIGKLNNNFEFMVVPINNNPKNLKSASDIKKIFKDHIKPSEFNLRVIHLITLNSLAIRVIAKTVDLDKLRESEKLKEIGLKIMNKERLKPRLLIKDFPMNIAFSDILANVAEAVGYETDTTEIRVITEFIDKNKRYKNVLIEATPQARNKLMTYGRLYINYESCRIEDYIRVLQCYKCLKFNHTAKNCTASVTTCGHCAGEHNSRECKQKDKIKCANCDRQGLTESNHSALDTQKCPVQMKRKNDLARSIDYETL